jgi:hypothetical protein
VNEYFSPLTHKYGNPAIKKDFYLIGHYQEFRLGMRVILPYKELYKLGKNQSDNLCLQF